AAFRTQCTIRNAGTDEIFPRRSCAEMFRLSPYCPERPIRTAVFPTKHQPAMRRQIKEFGQTRSPLRFFTACRTFSAKPAQVSRLFPALQLTTKAIFPFRRRRIPQQSDLPSQVGDA